MHKWKFEYIYYIFPLFEEQNHSLEKFKSNNVRVYIEHILLYPYSLQISHSAAEIFKYKYKITTTKIIKKNIHFPTKISPNMKNMFHFF